MAKYEYPLRTLSDSLKLAEGIDSLGGNCTRESAAESIGKKNSGSFNRLIGSAKKYNLINTSKGSLSLTEHYKKIKNSYNDEEKNSFLIESFLGIPLFKELHTRFAGKELNAQVLPKFMVRECSVDENNASLVANYFITGLKNLNLIDNNKVLPLSNDIPLDRNDEKDTDGDEKDKNDSQDQHKHDQNQPIISTNTTSNTYQVHFTGPGINSILEINEEEDLIIVEATLSRIKKKLNNGDS